MPLVLLLLLLALAGPVSPAPAAAQAFPEVIALPNGFQPEGIATGRGASFYVGSIPTGAIYRGSLRTGRGAVLVPPQAGRAAVGIEVDRRGRIFVAGGMTGEAYVYDARTGRSLAAYRFAEPGQGFINDVVVTRDAAYFTDSRNQRLGVVPFRRGGRLPAARAARTLALTGDLVPPATGLSLNGIESLRAGQGLVAVQTATGKLFRIDPGSGETDEIEVEGGPLTNGDGLLRRGRILYVVQNCSNQVAAVRLDRTSESGRVTGTLTRPELDVPTTVAAFGSALYTVNARFGTPPTPETRYDVVRLEP